MTKWVSGQLSITTQADREVICTNLLSSPSSERAFAIVKTKRVLRALGRPELASYNYYCTNSYTYSYTRFHPGVGCRGSYSQYIVLQYVLVNLCRIRV